DRLGMNLTKTILICVLVGLIIILAVPILMPRWGHRERGEPLVKIVMRNLLGALQYSKPNTTSIRPEVRPRYYKLWWATIQRRRSFLILQNATNSAGEFVDPWRNTLQNHHRVYQPRHNSLRWNE